MRNLTVNRFVLTLAIVLAITVAFFVFTGNNISSFNPRDHVSRFDIFQNSPQIDLWREWWHQNFYDPATNLSGKVFFNSVGNLNDPEKGMIMVYLSVYNGSKLLNNFIDTFGIDEYESNLYQNKKSSNE